MQVRRWLSFAERAVGSASQQGRKWYGYNAYRPENLAKLLEIFRVFYNYCIPDSKGLTPAVKLGLARGPVAPEAVLYYEPKVTSRKPWHRVEPSELDEFLWGAVDKNTPWAF